MENTNTVSIPLVDILSELLGKRVVMSGDDYVFFENLEKVSQDKIDEAMILKEQKEKDLSVPTSITMRQCRLYLLNQNLLDDVENIVSQNRAWQIEWEYANEVLRTNQLITAMQSSLNLTNEQVDAMFLEASKL